MSLPDTVESLEFVLAAMMTEREDLLRQLATEREYVKTLRAGIESFQAGHGAPWDVEEEETGEWVIEDASCQRVAAYDESEMHDAEGNARYDADAVNKAVELASWLTLSEESK